MIDTLITGGVAIVVCLINNFYQQMTVRKKFEEHYNEALRSTQEAIDLINYKLVQLTDKVELQKNSIDRLCKIESNIMLHEEKIKVMNHRIKGLEEN